MCVCVCVLGMWILVLLWTLKYYEPQETQTGALYQPRGVGWGGRWEGGSKGRGYMYTYGWLMLRFDKRQQNSVKQLSFKKKLKTKQKK